MGIYLFEQIACPWFKRIKNHSLMRSNLLAVVLIVPVSPAQNSHFVNRPITEADKSGPFFSKLASQRRIPRLVSFTYTPGRIKWRFLGAIYGLW